MFYHPAHLVGSSPYPLLVSFHIYFFARSLLMYFKYGSFLYFTKFGIISLLFVLRLWFKDICIEGLSGHHNFIVQSGFKTRFLLFLFREAIFFISIFWVFLDASLSPTVEVGGVWPPYGLALPNYLGIPLFGTVLLLRRGASLTWSHAQLLSNKEATWTLSLTIFLALLFTCLQFYEYRVSELSIRDGICGSLFYFSTGFHGLHVILGSIFLFFNLVRMYFIHFSPSHHIGFECSILYWHFVDVIWVLLYILVYMWGS